MKQRMMLTIALACVWLVLSGHLEPLMLTFGALSIAFVVWLSQRMNVVDGESYPFGLLPRLVGYWLWLSKEIVKSSLDVTRRVFSSKAAVKPLVFDAPTNLKSELGLVIFANSITLTPGTVSLAVWHGRIRVHALHPDVAKDLAQSGMDERIPEMSP